MQPRVIPFHIVVVVLPRLIAGVIWRININNVNFIGVCVIQYRESMEIISFNDEICWAITCFFDRVFFNFFQYWQLLFALLNHVLRFLLPNKSKLLTLSQIFDSLNKLLL